MKENLIDGNINIESTKEEVANFLSNTFKLSKEIANNIIKEDISGEVLLYLETNDFKLLGIKIGQIKKIQLFLKNNENKFIIKPFKEIININSNEQDVKSFFDKYLSFKGNLNDINGKNMIELTIEDMKNIGLNLGQRKKLIKYI